MAEGAEDVLPAEAQVTKTKEKPKKPYGTEWSDSAALKASEEYQMLEEDDPRRESLEEGLKNYQAEKDRALSARLDMIGQMHQRFLDAKEAGDAEAQQEASDWMEVRKVTPSELMDATLARIDKQKKAGVSAIQMEVKRPEVTAETSKAPGLLDILKESQPDPIMKYRKHMDAPKVIREQRKSLVAAAPKPGK